MPGARQRLAFDGGIAQRPAGMRTDGGGGDKGAGKLENHHMRAVHGRRQAIAGRERAQGTGAMETVHADIGGWDARIVGAHRTLNLTGSVLGPRAKYVSVQRMSSLSGINSEDRCSRSSTAIFASSRDRYCPRQ